ncbi:polysaccharide deacetylase family protein [Blastococcus capsensis]|uniref:polysaccharide deacetylase family protein n=1 Tax=Blastococcus capsensis TaxID=1564163 RepID=UPI003D6C2489
MTRARSLRRLASPALLAALAVSPAAPAHAGGVGPGPGQGWPGERPDRHDHGTGRADRALTFHDGPNQYDTPRLLDVLEETHVEAVFCLWGDSIEQWTALSGGRSGGGGGRP